MSDKTQQQVSKDPEESAFEQEQAGFHQSLGPRQLQMIAIGGAIGTGLFLGAGGRLASAGPSLFLDYALCGIIAYLILRALGELVVHRPSSGSFVSYTREFYGEKAAYVSGWMYWLNWATTAIVDSTAIAIYVHWFGQYSAFIDAIPQWLIALLVIVIVVLMNLISVKVFGEMEFWFALIKVVALVTFLVLAIFFVIFGTPTGSPRGLGLITDNGGLFPNGIMPALVIMQGVVFAYASIELVGTTSGETKNAEKVIPKAINTVILRIAVFYVGAIFLLCLLLPYTAFSADESPFVTFFSSINVSAAGPIMELVVITAALSSLNAGLYSTGRILHSMSMAGSAPKFAQHLTKSGVPYGGILLTAGVALLGVVLNYFVPDEAFEIVLNIASLGIIAGWAAITLAHMKFVQLAKQGKYKRPEYRAPWAPFTNWITLVFLVGVVVLIGFDYPVGTYTLASMIIIIPALIIGWFVVRTRVRELAAEREGFTGMYPIVADRPAAHRDNRHHTGRGSTTIIHEEDDPKDH
ncbi:amino acid permease [Kocuria massiliensis]|uniref:amino acid permease n=1 Tax=Kocuria massiliensis TaxID=1926282 RepID=UPI000A1C7ECB|nr:amino acid permease [Kocuria massiliensis]